LGAQGRQLRRAEIILGSGADSTTKLHELGHVEQGLLHPEDAIQQGPEAEAATTDEAYRGSLSERYANEFAEEAKKKDDPILRK
jgi:hypothetical protein